MRLFLLLLGAVLGAPLPAPELLAQAKQGLWKPPIALSTNIAVGRGDRIKVTLRGFQGNNPVEYTIARPPSHGSLSEIVQPDPDRVTDSTDGFVVYTHDNSDDSATDEFTFRARGVRGGGVSAPAKVRINIRDRPPVLAAPRALDFRAVAGESTTRPLSLTNAGGGLLRIDCGANPPFEIVGPEVIELARGASTNVLVRYTPRVAGEVAREAIRPGLNDPTRTEIILLGESVAPFEVSAPANGELDLAGDKSRAGSLTLLSRATEPQEIAVTTEPAGLVDIRPPVPVPLPPGATVPVDLCIPPERSGERQEVRVRLTTASHQSEVTLVAPPVPPDLQLLTRQADFTQKGNRTAVTVTNEGGVTGLFKLSPAPGLFYSSGNPVDAREFEVKPGSQTSVEISLDVPPGAKAPAELLVEMAGRTERVSVIAPPPDSTTPPTPPPILPPPPPPPPWQLNRDVRVTGKGGASPSLEWKKSKGDWQEPRLEVFRDGRWSTCSPPPDPPPGIFQRIGDGISDFFGRLFPPRPPLPETGEADAVSEWTPQAIDRESATGDDLRWRITARRGDGDRREQASADFLVDWSEGQLREARDRNSTIVPPTTTTPLSRSITRAIKVESARANPRRDSATIEVVFPRDPEADGYRLEHGFHPTLLDESTGLPYPGDFRSVPHPTAEATVVGMANTEREGREFTVLVATIEGLKAGTSTTWRVVTMAEGNDRWPTGEFVVRTLPPWQFPWRGAMLGAAVVALAAVLYLRWRINRAPL